MNSINPHNFFSVHGKGDKGLSYLGGNDLVTVSTSQELKTDLSLTTNDGDKVTLKSVVGRTMTKDSVDKPWVEGSKNRLWIDVKGDLTEQEMEDITKALDAIEQSMNALANKEDGKIFASSIDIKDFDSLSTFSGGLKKIDKPEDALSEQELQNTFRLQRQMINEHFGYLGDNLASSVKNAPVEGRQMVREVNQIFAEVFTNAGKEQQISQEKTEFIREIHIDLLEKLDFKVPASRGLIDTVL